MQVTEFTHSTGDLGLDLILDILEKLQWNDLALITGSLSNTLVFHPGARAKSSLGASVSANVYYLYELSGIYSRSGIGYERSSQMAHWLFHFT